MKIVTTQTRVFTYDADELRRECAQELLADGVDLSDDDAVARACWDLGAEHLFTQDGEEEESWTLEP